MPHGLCMPTAVPSSGPNERLPARHILHMHQGSVRIGLARNSCTTLCCMRWRCSQAYTGKLGGFWLSIKRSCDMCVATELQADSETDCDAVTQFVLQTA